MAFPKRESWGPLGDLLLKCCPPNKRGETSINVLSPALNVSRHSIYKWLRQGKIPPSRALQLVDLAATHRADVTLAQFSPFVYA